MIKYQLQNLSDVGCGTRPYWAGKDLLSTRQNNRHSFNLWQRTMPCNGNRQRVQMLQKRIFYAVCQSSSYCRTGSFQVTTRKKSLVAQTNYLPTRTVPRSLHPGGEASNRWAIMQKLRLLTASIHCPPQRLCWRGAPRDLTAQKKVLRCVAAPPRCLLRGGGCGLVVVKQLKTLADANGPAFVA